MLEVLFGRFQCILPGGQCPESADLFPIEAQKPAAFGRTCELGGVLNSQQRNRLIIFCE